MCLCVCFFRFFFKNRIFNCLSLKIWFIFDVLNDDDGLCWWFKKFFIIIIVAVKVLLFMFWWKNEWFLMILFQSYFLNDIFLLFMFVRCVFEGKRQLHCIAFFLLHFWILKKTAWLVYYLIWLTDLIDWFFLIFYQIIIDYAWIKEDFNEEKISTLLSSSSLYDYPQQWPFLSVKIGQKVEIIEQQQQPIKHQSSSIFGDFCLVKIIQNNEFNDQRQQQQFEEFQQQQGLVPYNILRFPLQKHQQQSILSSTTSMTTMINNHQSQQQQQQRPTIISTTTLVSQSISSNESSPITTTAIEGKYCYFFWGWEGVIIDLFIVEKFFFGI